MGRVGSRASPLVPSHALERANQNAINESFLFGTCIYDTITRTPSDSLEIVFQVRAEVPCSMFSETWYWYHSTVTDLRSQPRINPPDRKMRTFLCVALAASAHGASVVHVSAPSDVETWAGTLNMPSYAYNVGLNITVTKTGSSATASFAWIYTVDGSGKVSRI